MHPIYTRGFFRCLTRVSPSVAAPSSKKWTLNKLLESRNRYLLVWIKPLR